MNEVFPLLKKMAIHGSNDLKHPITECLESGQFSNYKEQVFKPASLYFIYKNGLLTVLMFHNLYPRLRVDLYVTSVPLGCCWYYVNNSIKDIRFIDVLLKQRYDVQNEVIKNNHCTPPLNNQFSFIHIL